MITFFSPRHSLHCPEYEFHRGERVPCFETPARAEIVRAELVARGHELREPTQDSSTILPRVHSERYLEFLRTAWDQWLAADPTHAEVQPFPAVWPIRTLRNDLEPLNFTARLGLYSMDNESPLVEGTWTAAKEGADAVVSAVALLGSGTRAAFSATRPPGHHSGPDFMGGYCFLNNAAIAAEALLRQECRRVAILDVDYHHGNGTQAIFYQRSNVLTVSIHGDPRTEYPFFLGHSDETGEGDGDGFNLNLPLPAGTPTTEWFDALDFACARVSHHRPDALVVSLGLDTFEGDPISRFKLQSEDFTRVGARLAQLSLPTVIVLEGGYATKELGVNACNVLEGFEGGMSVRKVVVTGGPGAGKTVLLDELARRGHPYVSESARAVIRERLAQGLPPRPSPADFAHEILRRDIEQYRSAPAGAGLLFFDRSILDALGMLDQLGALSAPERDRYVTEYPYHNQVFLLPPWEAIYEMDSERDQTFTQSVRVHDGLRQWYLRCGYEIVAVPPGAVADRCDFVLKTLESGRL